MSPETEVKINRISRYLYIYASMIAIGVVWNIADGEIENVRDFVRGIIRAAVMVYLSKTIWDLKNVSWWAITISSCVFTLFGVIGVVVVFIGGVAYANTQLLFIGVIVLPATILLLKIFLLTIQKDVRQQFVNKH